MMHLGGPNVNEIEHVSSDNHHMSSAGGPQVWCPGEGGGGAVQLGAVHHG